MTICCSHGGAAPGPVGLWIGARSRWQNILKNQSLSVKWGQNRLENDEKVLQKIHVSRDDEGAASLNFWASMGLDCESQAHFAT